ncbi:Octaprenyl diphosphate synthase / Dimethylallyltransferase / (2E,6E)-farnesyl diphosphate synthase / Geranylgeranyl pyrophosphate synthetase [hydrothermal vent metagenome]|uniref:Octaprenyl diphosphate synthase / Dimethylallyltransferase / (2E,6E)-farnesyl diphosphate synthase / Geranylgeranyl pyrophosphate synthetase n=1 Tax=hydrothermal vent metagenome TaxID=652676 RepID=A0A1W1C4Q8_9ZZZZ
MLNSVERQIIHYIKDLNEPEILNLYNKLAKGKRLRAKLILKIAGSSLRVIKTASIVEMIHGASLLHDDVIDDSDMRRNRPSINSIYGNKTAIMFGDILYSKGFYELNEIDKRVSKIISNAVVQLSLGELADVSLSKDFNIDRDVYLKMIYQKTASLIEASAESASILAGKESTPYKTYGKNLGLAFQMIDDILDITVDSQTLGKPAMHDFFEGKTTLPYIYLYEKLNKDDKNRLKSLHGKRLDSQDELWIKLKMKEYKIIEYSYNEAKELIDEAIFLMENAGEFDLSAIAKEMIERNF